MAALKPHQAIATAIIACRVHPGQEEAFRVQQKIVQNAAAQRPGFVHAELIPPVPGIQDEHIVVFRFENGVLLREWLDSPEREEVIAKLREYLAEPQRTQVVAHPPSPVPTVSMVFSHRVLPGKLDAYRRWNERILAAARQFRGYVDSQAFEPVPGVQDAWVNILRFRKAGDMERWLGSDERKALLAELPGIVAETEVRRLATGLEGWFARGDEKSAPAGPLPWKQALAILVALYPTTFLVKIGLTAILPLNTPLPTSNLLGNIVAVAIMTWLLMPHVTKALSFWLFPAKPSVAADCLGGSIIIAIVAIMFAIFFWLF
jgi:hypothetical protein